MKNCKKGYPCGSSCISIRFACRKNFPEGISIALDTFRATIPTPKTKPERFSSNQDEFKNITPEALGNKLGVSKERAEEMIKTINLYTANDYAKIVDYQLGIDNSLLPQTVARIENQINTISEFLEKAPTYNGEVYRGMKYIPSELALALTTNGQEIELQSFSSWSRKSSIASSFSAYDAQGYLLKIKSKSGVYIKSFSNEPDEDEVLMPSKIKVRVVSANKDTEEKYDMGPGFNLIELEEID